MQGQGRFFISDVWSFQFYREAGDEDNIRVRCNSDTLAQRMLVSNLTVDVMIGEKKKFRVAVELIFV